MKKVLSLSLIVAVLFASNTSRSLFKKRRSTTKATKMYYTKKGEEAAKRAKPMSREKIAKFKAAIAKNEKKQKIILKKWKAAEKARRKAPPMSKAEKTRLKAKIAEIKADRKAMWAILEEAKKIKNVK